MINANQSLGRAWFIISWPLRVLLEPLARPIVRWDSRRRARHLRELAVRVARVPELAPRAADLMTAANRIERPK